MNPGDCLEEGLFVITLLFHFTPDPNVIPMHEVWGTLLRSKAYIVGSFIWEFPQLPEAVIRRFPRTNLIHVYSQFLKRLVEPYPNFLAPLPIKPLPHRGTGTRSYKVGGIVSAHPRKNIEGWIELRKLLPAKWEIALVAEGDLALSPKGEALREAGIEVLSNLSEEELVEFYHSLDWFISLSTGEGYNLPAREALKCGVPVILGKHTGHLDLDGLPGVALVSCEEIPGDKHYIPTSIVYSPNIKEIVEIITQVEPPEVPQELPLPTWEQWQATWHGVLLKASTEQPKKVTMLKEKRAFFVLYPAQVGGGLNWSSILWGERTNCGFLYYPKVEKVDKPIIVPMHGGLIHSLVPHNFGMFLAYLKEKQQEGVPIIAWLHHFLPPGDGLWSLIRGCCTHVSTTVQNANFLYLPLPLGNPPGMETEGDFLLYWGYNPQGWDAAIALAEQLSEKLKIVTSPHSHWKPDYSYAYTARKQKGSDISLQETFSEEEMERLLDQAKGYIVIDIGGLEGEVSGRVAAVIRKRKPILANYSLRTSHFAGIIPLLSPLKDEHPQAWAASMARSIKSLGLQAFTPRQDKIPTVETEISIFEKCLASAQRGFTY